MFPYRDHNPSDRVPYVTYLLMALNIGIWLSYGLGDEYSSYRVYVEWGLQPREITNGQEYQTLFTSMFLHGGFMHLAGNMLFLYIFGDNLEDYLGHVGFLLFYLLGGLAAFVLHVYVDPNSNVPTVGASGAIAAVMGGYLLLFPKARVDILVILIVFIRSFALPAYVTLLFWFAFQVIQGVISDGVGGVAYWAHAGGFIAGFVLIGLIWLLRGRPEAWPELVRAAEIPNRPGRPRPWG